MSRTFIKRALLCAASLGLSSLTTTANASLLYAVYTGSQNGVTVRDADTYHQYTYFDPGFAVSGIAAGLNNDMYLTSGNSIHRYSNTGIALGSFSFPDPAIVYNDVTLGNGNIFASYSGSQNGVTVRNANSFAQSTFFDPGYPVNDVGSNVDDQMYLVSGDKIQRYNSAGALQAAFAFGDPTINYTQIDVAIGYFYAVYQGSQNGVTVRDALTFNQVNYFDPGFASNGLAAGINNDMFLTSGDSIYRYGTNGAQISSFTFGDRGIVYTNIAFAAVPEPGSIAMILTGLLAFAFVRRKSVRAPSGAGEVTRISRTVD